jgi:prolyl oligopeptidase
MNRALCTAALLLTGAATALCAANPAEPLTYPTARRSAQSEEFHGIKVEDPYRWMEDIDSPETRAWVDAQSKLSRGYLDAIPGREEIAGRLRAIWNFERWTPPVHHGESWFYSHNDGLQNQSVVYVTTDPTSPGHVLLDPNTLSSDGTLALRETAVSADGRLFAYALSEAGSDWQIWHVRDVRTGKDLADTLRWSKAGGGSWRKDGSGFYYTAYDAPTAGMGLKAANEFEKLYFHRLGTAQSADTLIYTRKDDPHWFVDGTVTEDGRYLVVQAALGTDERNTLLVGNLTGTDAALMPIVAQPSARYDVIGTIGSTLLVRTDDDAARYRIVAIDVQHPERAHWHSVVPESADTMTAATLVGGQIIVHRLRDAHSVVERYSPEGRLLGDVELPGIGTAEGFEGRAEDTQTYFSFSSYSTPPSVMSLTIADGKLAVWRSPTLAGFDPAQFESKQVFCTGKDGTKVPMLITARKGTTQNGANPAILYGYGGFNIPLTPSFSPAIAAWLQGGGIYVVANLRGGGEYGRAWHEAGMKTHKQNVFDDFIAAADYLHSTRWTNPGKLAIYGRSNGGLLIGAVEEQRPDIAAAAIPQVGVMDMLRFGEFTVGKAWESDYGSVRDPMEFRALYAYSPYHNARAGIDYPATLILTGDHDDRVFPAHSFKFAAAMQHADPHGKPILLRVETRAGHGQGMPTAKRIDEVVDIYSFIGRAFSESHPSGAQTASKFAENR